MCYEQGVGGRNTLIIFCSDHGECCGSHGMFGKNVVYDASSRVPFLIKLPRQREQCRVAAPVSMADLVPTVLDAVGAPAPDGLHGRSLLPLMKGEKAAARDVIIQWHRKKGMIPVPSMIRNSRFVKFSSNISRMRSSYLRECRLSGMI